MSKNNVHAYGCNILINCGNCGTIFYDIPSSIEYNSYDKVGNYIGSRWRKIRDEDITVFLQKYNWRQLFTGGYICENCYKNAKNIKEKNISKELGFEKDHC